jgi:hypothetical protein
MLLFLFPAILIAGEKQYRHYPAVIHVHSAVSSGKFDFAGLAKRARKWNIPILIFTDHQRHTVEYGLWPFRETLKRGGTHPSIDDCSAARYIAEIDALDRANPDMVLIPGMELVPYYYYTGGYFSGDLRIHDFHRNMIVFGLPEAADFDALPTIHGPWSLRFLWQQLPAFLVMLALIAAALIAMRRVKKRLLRIMLFMMLVFFVLGAYNDLPVRNTRYSQYAGPVGGRPYQDVIDAVHERGGIIAWAHPEAYQPVGVQRVGPVEFVTEPYPELVFNTRGSDAFAGVYGDMITFTQPGGPWDRALADYCAGAHEKPPYIFGERDYAGPPVRLNLHQTVFLLKELSREEVFAAFREGRMYAMQAPRQEELRVDLAARAPGKNASVIMGGTLHAAQAEVSFEVRCERRVALNVEIIKDGRVIQKLENQKPPIKHGFIVDVPQGKTTYVRLTITGAGKVLLTNPVFISNP